MEREKDINIEDYKPKFKRIQGFNPNTYPKTKLNECNTDEKAEYARAIIKSCVLGRSHVPVHVSNPTPLYMLYKAVFEDMLQDPELSEEFKEELRDFGLTSSLSAMPVHSLVVKLAESED